MIPERRRIREDEAAVIRAALERAPVGTVNDSARNDIENLEVIARCECGCASVDFGSPAAEARPSPIADGTATRPSGGQIGVIVWGRSDAITGLEIYGLGDGNDDLVLPIPESIVPW